MSNTPNANREAILQKLDEIHEQNPKATSAQLVQRAGCSIYWVNLWRRERGLARTKKHYSPDGQSGYHKLCPGCQKWYWTAFQRQIYCTQTCYRQTGTTPIQAFLAKLGRSEEIAPLIGTTDRWIRKWHYRGIPEMWIEPIARLARRNDVSVTEDEIRQMNLTTAKMASYRTVRHVGGKRPATSITESFERDDPPSKHLEVTQPTELAMAQLTQMLDGKGCFIRNPNLAKLMMLSGWVVLNEEGLWRITEHGMDAVLASDVKEYTEARRKYLAKREARRAAERARGTSV